MFAASKSGQATGAAPPPPPTPTTDPQFPYVTALLTGDGTNGAQNNTFIDSSPNNFAITRNGNTTQGSASPYGGNWSNYFDGAGDHLTLAASANWVFTGDHTIEAWVYIVSLSANGTIYGTGGPGSADQLTYESTGALYWANQGTGTGVITRNNWIHVAVARSGTTLKIFINGTAQVTATVSGTVGQNLPAYIGMRSDATNSVNGYISNLRIINGTALYTANFTPPTAPLTAITNTALLTCQSPRFVDNSFNNFTVTNNGNTSTQVFSPFEPATLTPISYSGYFDGSGDYLSIASNAAFNFGTGDFTIEAWVYPTSFANDWFIASSSGAGGMFFGFRPSVQGFGWGQTGIAWNYEVTSGTINAWQHVAVSRSGTSMRLFVNGVQVGTTQTNSTSYDLSTTSLTIGSQGVNYFLPGNLSNLRIVKGTAVYTANFTPSTTPLTAITNTSLLTCQSNTFVDNSPNNFSITPFGDAKTTIQNPFGASTVSQYFDGSGDYLTIPASSNVTLGTNNHTIECWYYATGSQQSGMTLWAYASGSTNTETNSYYLSIGNGSGNLLLGNGGGGWGINIAFTSPSQNAWHHVAVVRSGNVFTLYFDGVSVGTGTYSANITSQVSFPFEIGGQITGSGTLGGTALLGYVSNFRIVNGTAVYTSNFTPSATPLTAIAGTSLLTCQNLTAIDNSPNVFPITTGGNTFGSLFNPFPFGTTSALTTGYRASVASGSVTFNGSSNVLTGPTSNTLFQLTANGGTGLTVEAWIYPTSVGGSRQIASYYNYNDGGAEQGWYFRVLDGQLQVGNANGGTSRSGGSIPVNTWTHVAFVINSGSFYLYVNGVSVGSVTGVGSQNYSSATLVIGGIKQNGTFTNQVFNGSISNLRTTNTAVYTANFTPPTAPLTAVSGTTLLTCQSSTSITDASSNVFTITSVGTPVTTVANPFGITSVNGASMYFDGNGDYLNTPSNAAFGFGTGDFTIEGWFYFTGNVGTYQRPWWFGDDNENLEILSSVIRFGGASITLITGPTAVANTWYHIAYSRASGSGRLYVNGNQVGSTTANSYSSSTRTFTLMATSGGSGPSTGYVSNFRIVKGTALYTANFVPPVAPVTAISGTSLLLNGTNGGIIDNAMMNDYETVGNTQISTAVVKYGTGSMYFDGTGDYLQFATNAALAFGTGDFAAECWVNFSTNNGTYNPFVRVDGSGTFDFGYDFSTAQLKHSGAGAIFAVSQTFTAGIWYHVALTRASGSCRLFVNGIQVGTTVTGNTDNYGSSAFKVGASSYSGAHVMAGYIDDLRVTKGYARYVANFTPPTQAFPTY